MSGKYDDIIDMPHHVSSSRPRMSLQDRVAQFSPFAALTGYAAVIHETARLTERRIELDECVKEDLDLRLQILVQSLAKQPTVTVTYFLPDDRKEGGAYKRITGVVKKIDEYHGCIVMQDGSHIPIHDTMRIDGEVFKALD